MNHHHHHHPQMNPEISGKNMNYSLHLVFVVLKKVIFRNRSSVWFSVMMKNESI